MKIRLRRPNVFVLSIGMIYVISQNCLYLLPNSSIYSRVSSLLLMAVFLVSILLNKGKISKRHQFSLIMGFPVFLSFFASLREISIYPDADFAYSFTSQAQWWIYGFVYFSVVLLIDNKRITEKEILHMMVILGTIQLVIGITQFIFQSRVIFTYIKTSTRLDEKRFRFPIVMMCFCCMYGIGRIFKGKEIAKGIALIGATLFQAIFVQQFRSTAIGLTAAMIIGYLIWKKKFTTKFIVGLAAVIAFLFFYRNSTFLKTSFEFLLGGRDISLGVRSYNINFLIQNILKNPILGNGWVSSEQSAFFASTGYRLNTHITGFSFADGGIFSIAYSYGALGILWVIIFWTQLLKNGIEIIKIDGDYTYFLFPLYMIITMYLDIHWYIYHQFYVMALFSALSEYKLKALRRKQFPTLEDISV